jgi:PAS domain S-box-containing protein
MQTDNLFLTGIIDALPVALFCKDYADEGKFVCWNKQAEITWGLKTAEVIGKNDYDFFPKDQGDYFKEKDLDTLNSGELLYIPEEPVDSPILGRRIVRTWKVPLNGTEGPRYLLGMSFDITEQKKVENELEKERLNTINNSKLVAMGEMAGGIAHEINNPLAILTMTCEVMKTQLELDTVNKVVLESTVDKISKTTDRISKVIKGLLNVSRESRNENISNSSLDLVFDDVMGLCLERFKIHGIELERSGEEALYFKEFPCNRVQLSQVFLNLLGNSFDAISKLDERWIKVDVKEKNDTLLVKLIDSGKGIPIGIREKIFQPFFSNKEVGKGTGIGLSISKDLMQKHEGDLTLNSNNPNTEFLITIPLKKLV